MNKDATHGSILTWHIRKQMTFHESDVDVWKRWQVIVSIHTRGVDCFRLVVVVDVVNGDWIRGTGVHHSSACREVSERVMESFEISEISECVHE